MIILIYAHKQILVRINLPTVQVFATLLLLSYAKLLHAVITAFALILIASSSTLGLVIAWKPNPNVPYLQAGGHITLFVVALLFVICFIIPFAFGLTFPNQLMRSQKVAYYLYPLVDCFAAPYKNKYRFWIGARALLLIYTVTEVLLFSSDEALLMLSNIFVVGFFAFIQAFLLPFKTHLFNVLDLLFMGIYLILSIVTRILLNNGNSDIAVNFLGYFSFSLFWFIVIYHFYTYTLKQTSVGEHLNNKVRGKIKKSCFHKCKLFISAKTSNARNCVLKDEDIKFTQFRESLLQYDN